jgi:hypothetical protein
VAPVSTIELVAHAMPSQSALSTAPAREKTTFVWHLDDVGDQDVAFGPRDDARIARQSVAAVRHALGRREAPHGELAREPQGVGLVDHAHPALPERAQQAMGPTQDSPPG